MKIADIRPGMSNIAIEAKVVDKGEVREVQTRYGPRSVADFTLEDDTGQISLSLWEKQINSVAIGDTVSIDGGYSTQFRDKLQLNIPKNGKLEITK